MENPTIERHGDAFGLAWAELGVAYGFERLKRGRDGLEGMVIIDASRPDINGRVLGPIKIHLEDVRSHSNIVNGLQKRVNHAPWYDLTTMACAIVAKQFNAPSPTVKVKNVQHSGPVEYLVPGLIPKGETTFIYGDSESCKSLLALLIGMSVQTGTVLPWGVTPEQANVLYLDWETNDKTVSRRVSRLCAGGAIGEIPDMDYRGTVLSQKDAVPLRLLEDEMQSIRSQISKDNIGLVIVDSIGFAVRGKLTDDDIARQAMMDLRLLAPATRLVVAHISKASAEDSTSKRVDPFGSAFFRAGLRSGFEIRRSNDGDAGDKVDIGVYHHKSNDSKHMKPFGLTVEFLEHDEDDAILVSKTDIMDVADLAVRTPLSSRIRAMLKKGAANTKEIAESLETTEATVRNTVKKMPDVQALSHGTKGTPSSWGLSDGHF